MPPKRGTDAPWSCLHHPEAWAPFCGRQRVYWTATCCRAGQACIYPPTFCPLFDGPRTPPWEASAYKHHPSYTPRDHLRFLAGSKCVWMHSCGPGVPGCAFSRHVSSILAPGIHLFSSPSGPRNMMGLAFGLFWSCLIFLWARTWCEMPSYVTFGGLLLPYPSLPPSYPHCLPSLRPSHV